jgi:hypothetical protein
VVKQTQLAVAMYQVNWRFGLRNVAPGCPFPQSEWGTAHQTYTDPLTSSLNGYSGQHIWSEGRSLMCWWRGYLVAQGEDTKILGCPFTDFRGKQFYASYNGGGVRNHVETNNRSDAFRRNPAFVWYGPGAYDTGNVRYYAGGNIHVPGWSQGQIKYERFGPLFCCPQVWIEYSGGNKGFQPSHRPQWFTDGVGATAWPFAGNVAYTDGSVKFFTHEYTGTGYWFNPMP